MCAVRIIKGYYKFALSPTIIIMVLKVNSDCPNKSIENFDDVNTYNPVEKQIDRFLTCTNK